MVGELELARLVLDGAGERALLEPEQLRLEQLGRQRRAVHFYERLVLAQRLLVQRAGDELFADAALAANQHRHVGVGDALDQVADLGHLLAVAEEHRVARLLLELRAQRRDLLAQLMLFERLLDHHLQLVLLERLAEEVGGAEPHRLDDHARAPLPGDDDDRDVLVDLLERGQRGQPVHAAGHDDVEQHRGGTVRVEPPHLRAPRNERRNPHIARSSSTTST